MNSSIKQPMFVADKVSGLPANLYYLSVILEVIKMGNARMRFNFQPLYGMTFNLEKEKADEWIDEAGYLAESLKTLDYVQKNGVGYFERLLSMVVKEADELRQASLEVSPKISKLSDDDLLEAYNLFMSEYIYNFGPGISTFIYEGILSERLAQSVASRYSNATEIITASISQEYRSFITENERVLLALHQEIDENKKRKLISEYLENYFFMRASYLGSPIMTEELVLEAAEKVQLHSETIKNLDVLKEVEFTAEEQAIIDLMKVTEKIHDERKRTNLIGSYTMQLFLNEAVARTKFDPQLAKRIFWHEFKDIVYSPKELSERLKGRLLATFVLSGASALYLDGICIQERITSGLETELRGTPAAKGKITGVAKVILAPSDFDKLLPGEILITEMTRPDFLPVMKKAAAIVTDEGGLTCHAAIISRELNIPCIVGVKRGTKVFKDGDMVEVDASVGIVRIIN